MKRIGYVVSAIIYTTFAFTALALAKSDDASSEQAANGNAKVTNLTARIMGNDVGRWVIGLAGLVVIAAGIYRFVKGVTQDVEDELDLSGMSRERIVWTRRLGAVGEIGRGIAFAVIGFFLVRAAVQFDAKEATGLDGALRRLAEQTWGVFVVGGDRPRVHRLRRVLPGHVHPSTVAGTLVSAVMAEGPVSRSLERRFASAPRIVPLVTIVLVGYARDGRRADRRRRAHRARRCSGRAASVGRRRHELDGRPSHGVPRWPHRVPDPPRRHDGGRR